MKTVARITRLVVGSSLLLVTFLAVPLLGPSPRARGSEPELLSGPPPAPLPPPLLPHLPLPPAMDCEPKDPPTPVVKIKVRVPACADPGAAILYCICVENCSPAEAHHVVVRNALPANARYVKADPVPAHLAPELQWNLGTIGGHASREIKLWLTPTNTDDVKNCVRVQFEHGECVVTRQSGFAPSTQQPGTPGTPGTPGGPGQPPPFDATKPEQKPKVTTIPDVKDELPALDLRIDGSTRQHVKQDTRYLLTVTNKSKVKATNVQVIARLADKFNEVRPSKPGVAVDNEVAWNLGTIESGAERMVEVTVQAMEKGEHCIKATVIADQGVKKDAELCTLFVAAAGMTMEMRDREDPIFLGHKTSYPIIVRSQGSTEITNVKLKAFVPDALKVEKASVSFEKGPPAQGGQWLLFATVPRIDVGGQASYEIFVEAVQPGITRMHIEMSADQLDNDLPVRWQELTRIVDDRGT